MVYAAGSLLACPFCIEGSHSFELKKKFQAFSVFQSNFGIFQVLSIIVRKLISNTFGQQ